MKRSIDRILTTHTGSLPRSDALTDAMYDHQEGNSDDGGLETMFADEVDDIVARQRAAGLDVVNDGEVTKPGFANYIRDRLDGMGGQAKPWIFYDLQAVPDLMEAQYSTEAAQHIHMPACDGPLKYVGEDALARDIKLLKEAAATRGAEDVFMTAVSPGTIAYHASNEYYESYQDYLWAAAEAMQSEYEAIVAAGLNLQLDSPDIPCSHPDHCSWWSDETVAAVGGHLAFIELNLEAMNHATRNIDPEHLRMHLCWGNYAGPHDLDVPLKDVLQPVLDKARPTAILFEAANPRHEHEWRALETMSIPDDKVLVPGVIDTLTNFVEHPQVVADRIERFARVIGREQVMAGNDCGFGTFVGFGTVYPSVVWKKLTSLAAGARIASDRLWNKQAAAAGV